MGREREGSVVFDGERLAVPGKCRVGMVLFALLVALFVSALLADSAWAQDPPPPTTTISVTKDETNPEPVQVGETIEYEIVVLNTGTTTTAQDVQLVDVLPANTTFVSVSTNQGDCDALAVGASSGTITCDLGDIVAPGGGVTVTLEVRPTATAGEVGSVSNTATAQGTNTNTAADTEITQVEPSDITIRKDDSPDPADVGEALIYTLEVTNNSGSTRDLVIVDELPPQVDFIAVSPSDDCEETSGVVTCEFNNVPNGATRTVLIAVEPQEAGTIENTAQVFFADDLFTPIDQTTETTVVEGDADDTTDTGDDADSGDGTDDGDDDGDIDAFCSQIIGDITNSDGGITRIEGNRFCTTVINNFGDDGTDTDGTDTDGTTDTSTTDTGADTTDTGTTDTGADTTDTGTTDTGTTDTSTTETGDGTTDSGEVLAESETTDPDEQDPVDKVQGDVLDEVATEGELPNTGGPSVAAVSSLALVLFGVSLLALRLVSVWRGRGM